jgi:aspartate/methionine/tyrosine aminotransferase
MNDLQMVRGNVEGGFNLALGEPVLLQKHLAFPEFVSNGPYEYPTLDGNPALVEELLKLHPEAKYVVITNGAKQAILAAFYAFRETQGKRAVQHKAPYWPSYPTLAGMSGGMGLYTNRATASDISVITAPNNPDGRNVAPGASCDVWDAVYAHSLYGWDGVEPYYGVRIGSASKLLGLSGVRIGWAITNDRKMADIMRRYVEFTTSGVSQLSQDYLLMAIQTLNQHNPVTAFAAARQDMRANADVFLRLFEKDMDFIGGVPTTGLGMFAWVAPRDPTGFAEACAKARVAVVTGTACGTSDRWFRLNMCAGRRHTERALQAIRDNLQ